MTFSKTLALLAACATQASALTDDITVMTSGSTANSVNEAQQATIQSALQAGIREYSQLGDCNVYIDSATVVAMNTAGKYNWTFKVGVNSSGVLCTQTFVSGKVAFSPSTLKDKYNSQTAATAISGPAYSVTGVSSAGGLSAVIASAAAAVMLMVL